jgi:ABC-type multidrug transport system fused ATPase/permease subunit
MSGEITLPDSLSLSLSLSRSLSQLQDPPIVILDEATAALDTVTEKNIQEALAALGSNRTVLVIAHRLTTVRHADNIIVLDGGAIAETGTHQQLLEKEGGIYANMWRQHERDENDTNSSQGRGSIASLRTCVGVS